MVGRDDDVSLLQQILVEAVVDGVVPLHVPAVVVLVHAVAVNPHDGRVLLRAIQILRHEQPGRHRLTVRSRIADSFRLDERRVVDLCRHRIGQAPGNAERLTGEGRIRDANDEKIRRVLRIRVLIDQPRAIGRPLGRDISPTSGGDSGNFRGGRVAGDRGDVEMPRAVMIRLAGIERNPLAVGRPRRPPGFEPAFCDLNRSAGLRLPRAIRRRRRHHIEMIPAVAIAEKRNPFSVR